MIFFVHFADGVQQRFAWIHSLLCTLCSKDPGFPIGWGAMPIPLGGINIRCGHFLAKTYEKTKELGHVGGGGGLGAVDPL